MSSFETVCGGAVRLDDWGVILADGSDAPAFLHSQLTQSMQDLPPDRARLAGYCSPKGRLLATFVAWRRAPDGVALACSADLLPATLKRLSMFVLRAKCKLRDAGGSLVVWGLAGDEAARWLAADPAGAASMPVGTRPDSPGATWIRLADAAQTSRWLWVAPADMPAPPLPALPRDTWSWLEVRSGVARVVAATADHFVPQMLNLELVGGVDFRKGCYPGQEVVARSQYRGTLKRRTVMVEASGPLAPGAEVFHPSDPSQPAGEVVLAAPGPQGEWSALVEVKRSMLDEGLNFRSEGVDMRVVELPYALPADSP